MRIAQGEADGIALCSSPMRFAPKKSVDVLEQHLTGPFILTSAEWADRGLWPGGTLCPPKPGQVRTASPGNTLEEPRPPWLAAQRAAELLAKHTSLNEIGRQLHAEGFRPPRGGKWYAATVVNLLQKFDRARQNSTTQDERHPE